MYLARFSYDVLPVNRRRAIDFIQQEVKSASSKRLNARLLVLWHAFSEILTRPPAAEVLRVAGGSLGA
jgi:hypothetical protein